MTRLIDQLRDAQPACRVLAVSELGDAGAPTPAPVLLELDDPAVLIFTSATSGQPQGVLHSQRDLVGQQLQARQRLGLEPRDISWCTDAPGGRNRRVTRLSPRGFKERRHFCTTAASIRPSASSTSRGRGERALRGAAGGGST
jgi:non-ribosomal peptide synthetase component F